MDGAEMILSRMKVRRIGRAVMYFGLVLSGLFAAYDQSNLITQQVSASVATLWAVLMSISAGICFYGSVTDKWIGEYSGIPLLASVMAFYSLVIILSAADSVNYPLMAYGLLVGSFASGLCARWRDVQSIKKNASVPEGVHKRGGA